MKGGIIKEIRAFQCEFCNKKSLEEFKCDCVKDYSDKYSELLSEKLKWYMGYFMSSYARYKIKKWNEASVKVQFYYESEGFNSLGFKKFSYEDVKLNMNVFIKKYSIEKEKVKQFKMREEIKKMNESIAELQGKILKQAYLVDGISSSDMKDRKGNIVFQNCKIKTSTPILGIDKFEVFWDSEIDNWKIFNHEFKGSRWHSPPDNRTIKHEYSIEYLGANFISFDVVE